MIFKDSTLNASSGTLLQLLKKKKKENFIYWINIQEPSEIIYCIAVCSQWNCIWLSFLSSLFSKIFSYFSCGEKQALPEGQMGGS